MTKFSWNRSQVITLFEGILQFATVVEPSEKVTFIVTDETDNRILECALGGKADYIISGDKQHLLPLTKYEDILIVSASDFLSQHFPFNN